MYDAVGAGWLWVDGCCWLSMFERKKIVGELKKGNGRR